MRRQLLGGILSEQEQDLPEVWEWYGFQDALVGEEKSRVLSAWSGGTALSAPRYFGLTRDELDDWFDAQRMELDKLTMLGLIAATEAALRVDFIVRVVERSKDAVSRRFRQLSRRWPDIALEESILDVWRDTTDNAPIKNAVAEFKGVLKLRHWLAHGRYWKPRLGRENYDPIEVFAICDELLKAINAWRTR